MPVKVVYVDWCEGRADKFLSACIKNNYNWFDVRKCNDPERLPRHHPLLVLWADTFKPKGVYITEVSDFSNNQISYLIQANDQGETVIDLSAENVVTVHADEYIADKNALMEIEKEINFSKIQSEIESLKNEIQNREMKLKQLQESIK